MARLLKACLWLAQWVNQRSALKLSAWLAGVLMRLDTEAAQVTRANLRACFPELDAIALELLCRDSLRHMVLLFFEFAQLACWPKARLLGQVANVRGKQWLDEAYASGRGVVLLVPHFGNWELLCAFLGEHYRFAALYDRPKIANLESVIVDARQRFSGELFAIDTAGMRKLVQTLRAGSVIAILPDQVPDRSAGVYVDFFGQVALTMTLAHRLVSKHRPHVLMGSVQRQLSDSGYDYEICIEPLPDDLADGDAARCAQQINDAIERVVRRAPAQYQWDYKRFKRPPQLGKTSIYRRQ